MCSKSESVSISLSNVVKYAENSNFILDKKDTYQILLNQEPINKKNVFLYNNLAYYLGEKGWLGQAIFLLDSILAFNPNRVVAHLNIADYLLSNEKIEESIKHYSIYYDLMTQKGLSNKIPKRVFNILNL